MKTRIQLAGEGSAGKAASPLAVAREALRTEGPAAFYAGYSAAATRQIVYGSARLGLFRVFSDELRAARGSDAPLPLWLKAAAGLASGAVSSFVGNPFDLALVRMQADATLPPGERRGYTGVVDACRRVVRDEGVLALWRGSMPTVARAMALNAAMLATADQVKEALAPHLGGLASLPNLVASSLVAGVAASVASLPFDMVKTRLQKQRARRRQPAVRGLRGLLPPDRGQGGARRTLQGAAHVRGAHRAARLHHAAGAAGRQREAVAAAAAATGGGRCGGDGGGLQRAVEMTRRHCERGGRERGRL